MSLIFITLHEREKKKRRLLKLSLSEGSEIPNENVIIHLPLLYVNNKKKKKEN